MKDEKDFNEIVQDLLKSYTQMKLQELTGVHQGVISELKRGVKKPNLSYTYGNALVRAHNDVNKEYSKK